MKKETKTNNFKNAFTLLELVVSMGIFAILMTTTIAIFTRSISNSKKTRGLSIVSEEVNTIFNRISKGIRYAQPLQNNFFFKRCPANNISCNSDYVGFYTKPLNGNANDLVLHFYWFQPRPNPDNTNETIDTICFAEFKTKAEIDAAESIVQKSIIEKSITYCKPVISSNVIPVGGKFIVYDQYYPATSEEKLSDKYRVPYIIINYNAYYKDRKGKVPNTRVQITTTISARNVLKVQ